jgi:hypothetical protein
MFVRAMRSLNVGTNVKRHVQLKQRQRGFDEATYVKSFLVLNALGGDCLEDFDRLRERRWFEGDARAWVAEPGGGAQVSVPVSR